MGFSICIDPTHSTVQPQRDCVHFAHSMFINGLGAIILFIIGYLWYLVAHEAPLSVVWSFVGAATCLLWITFQLRYMVSGWIYFLLMVFVALLFASTALLALGGAHLALSEPHLALGEAHLVGDSSIVALYTSITHTYFDENDFRRGALSEAAISSSVTPVTHAYFDGNNYRRGAHAYYHRYNARPRTIQPREPTTDEILLDLGQGALSGAANSSSVAPIAHAYFNGSDYKRGDFSGAAESSSMALIAHAYFHRNDARPRTIEPREPTKDELLLNSSRGGYDDARPRGIDPPEPTKDAILLNPSGGDYNAAKPPGIQLPPSTKADIYWHIVAL